MIEAVWIVNKSGDTTIMVKCGGCHRDTICLTTVEPAPEHQPIALCGNCGTELFNYDARTEFSEVVSSGGWHAGLDWLRRSTPPLRSFKMEHDIDQVISAFEDARVGEGGWLNTDCPFCGGVGKFGLHTATGGFNCFKCSVSGKIPASKRAELTHVLSDEEVERDEVRPEVEDAEGYTPLFAGSSLRNRQHDHLRKYVVERRRISADVAKAMGIGTGTGRLGTRIVIPIRDAHSARGPWRGWYARDVTGRSKIPHLYSKGMQREDLLFNERALYTRSELPVVGVEGCIKGAGSWPHCVAFLGKPLPDHLDLLCRTFRPIIICLDGDAWEEGQALVWSLLARGKKAVNVRLPAKTDPDDYAPGLVLKRGMEMLKDA